MEDSLTILKGNITVGAINKSSRLPGCTVFRESKCQINYVWKGIRHFCYGKPDQVVKL